MNTQELSKTETNDKIKTTYRVGNLIVNVKSSFHPEKSLYDILFSIASMRLKEKSA